MSVTGALASTASGFLDRVLCVIGAVVFSQGPEFIQQYLQRLGGHVDEARRQLAQFHHAAEQSGVTLDQLIAQTHAAADPAVAKLGGVMEGSQARFAELEASQAAMLQANALERPFVFIRHADMDIVNSTWASFRPAVPATLEGLAYALAGMVLLLFLYHLACRLPARTAYRVWTRRRATRQVARA